MKKIALVLASIISAAQPAAAEPLDVAVEIHNRVNAEIEYKEDKKQGLPYYDMWQIPVDGKGDCEDFALLKKKLLIEAGFDEDDVKLMIVARKADVSLNKNGVFNLHVVNYIRSLDIVLDNSVLGASSVGPKKKKIPVATYSNYLKANNAEFVCFVVDETEGDDISIRRRCGVPERVTKK